MRLLFAEDAPRTAEFLRFNLLPSPNWSGHLLLAALQSVLPPLLSEKILLTLIVAGLPLALRFALGALRAERSWAILAMPFAVSGFLYLGFYNYCIGLPLAFVVLGIVVSGSPRSGPLRTGLLAAILLGLYFSNVVPLVAALVAAGTWTVGAGIAEARAAERGAAAGTFLRGLRGRLLPLAIAAVPPLLLAAAYGSAKGAGHVARFPLRRTASELARMEFLVGLSDAESVAARLLFLLFAAALLAVLVRRARRSGLARHDGLLAAAALSFTLTFAAPDQVSGAWLVSRRFAPFPFLFALLWFGAEPLPARFRRGTIAAGAVLSLALPALRAAPAAEIDRGLRQYVAAGESVPAGATLLPLSFAHRGADASGRPLSARAAPFLHAAGWIAAGRDVVDLSNYEGNAPDFLLMYRDGRNPFETIGRARGMEGEPPFVDFVSPPASAGGGVDYVLLWGVRPEHEHDLTAKAIGKQLGAAYEPAAVSPDGHSARLFRRRGEIRR